MQFMIIRKADAETEAGVLPGEDLIEAMTAYHEELAAAGILRGGDGLMASAHGARVVFSNGVPRVIDGPFAESKELIAGYTLIEVGSKAEALEWLKRWPPLDGHGAVELELRRVFSAEDFGEVYTDDIRQRQEEMARQEQAARQGR